MMRVSSSKMDMYHSWCKRKYRLVYIENIKPLFISPALSLGSLCHDEIKFFWKNYNLDLDTYEMDLEDYYSKRVKQVSYRLEQLGMDDKNFINFQMYFGNFIQFQSRRISRYIKLYEKDIDLINNYFYPKLNEEYGKIKISRNVEFGFIIDALFEMENNIYLLIDWKTDGVCNESQFDSHKPQLNRYSICIPMVFKLPCHLIGVYFLKESKFYKDNFNLNYSLENEVLDFVRELQISDFPKVDKKENYKCCTNNYQCEFYPDICDGNF